MSVDVDFYPMRIGVAKGFDTRKIMQSWCSGFPRHNKWKLSVFNLRRQSRGQWLINSEIMTVPIHQNDWFSERFSFCSQSNNEIFKTGKSGGWNKVPDVSLDERPLAPGNTHETREYRLRWWDKSVAYGEWTGIQRAVLGL